MNRTSNAAAKAVALAMTAATAANVLPVSAQQATRVAAPSATVMQLSEADCKVFAGMTVRVINSMGPKTLSADFINAMIDFGANRKCAGPYNIPTNSTDVVAYKSVTDILNANGISLARIGVRAVGPTAALTQN